MQLEELDLKDRKLLFELDLNCRRSNAEIGRAVGLRKEMVNYRISRLSKQDVITRFSTVIDTYKLGYLKFKLYLRLEDTHKEQYQEIIKALKENEKTEWIASCSGNWDIIAGFLVKNPYEFYKAERDFLNRFSQYVATKETSISLGVPHWQKEYLLGRETAQIPPVMQGDKQYAPETLDEIDERIVRILVNNARMPITEIAKHAETTARIAKYRIRELQRKGILLKHRIFLNLPLFNYLFCKAIITFKHLTTKKLAEFMTYCGQIPNLTYAIKCVGSWDLELDFEIESFNKFHETMFQIRDRFAEIIKNYEFVIILKEEKLDYYPGAYKQIGEDGTEKS